MQNLLDSFRAVDFFVFWIIIVIDWTFLVLKAIIDRVSINDLVDFNPWLEIRYAWQSFNFY